MANDKNEKKVKKEKKNFFKDFKAELKRVTWPTGKQLVNNTIAVITIVLITALIVFVLDLCFEKINTYGINGIKKATRNNETTVVENSGETTDNTDVENTTESETNVENTSDAQTTEGQEATPSDAE